MAFKSVEQFTEERFHNTFRLINDKDSADVIILYQSKNDVLVGDVHYIKAGDYSGYTHCLGKGCPICARKKDDGSNLIRVQTKVFIPIYNIEKDEIQFWDRNYNTGFIAQLDKDIFNLYANPSEVVFKITRNGAFNDKNTRYTFTALGNNKVMSYADILAKFNATMPDYYENIVKSFSLSELTTMMQSQAIETPTLTQDYVPVPRAGYQSSIPNTYVNAAEAVGGSDDDIESDSILSEFDGNDEEDTDLPEPTF